MPTDKTPDQLRRFKASRYVNQPLPDAPGECLTGPVIVTLPMPTWARYALRRGEDVPGLTIPMYQRWYQTCPVCHQSVFLIYPYLMPALQEIVAPDDLSDLVSLSCQSLVAPRNLIRTHEPCRFYELDVPWDFEEPSTLDLKDYA